MCNEYKRKRQENVSSKVQRQVERSGIAADERELPTAPTGSPVPNDAESKGTLWWLEFHTNYSDHIEP